jgi:hypothetical protein
MARAGRVITFEEFRELWQDGEQRRRLRGYGAAEELLGRGTSNRGGWAEWPDGTRRQRQQGWIVWEDSR